MIYLILGILWIMTTIIVLACVMISRRDGDENVRALAQPRETLTEETNV